MERRSFCTTEICGPSLVHRGIHVQNFKLPFRKSDECGTCGVALRLERPFYWYFYFLLTRTNFMFWRHTQWRHVHFYWLPHGRGIEILVERVWERRREISLSQWWNESCSSLPDRHPGKEEAENKFWITGLRNRGRADIERFATTRSGERWRERWS